jgi:signal peptidase I
MRVLLRWLGRLLTAALLAVFGLVVLVPAVTGSTTLTVLTGSMEPTINPGALIIVKPVAPEDIEVGSIITYRPASEQDILITHRVVRQESGAAGTTWVTRGDANGADDEPIVYEQVRGKVLFSLPYLGYVRQALTSQGPWLLIGVALIMVLALLWPLLTRRGRKGNPGAHAAPSGASNTPQPSAVVGVGEQRNEPVTATSRGASS